MPANELFKTLSGKWEGTCRTWFKPGELADESAISGTFEPVFDGRFLRHVYESTIQGNERCGEELITLNTVTKKYQLSWVDSFHMNYAIMFSEGDAATSGFSVRGSYDVVEDQPKWGWKTVYELDGDRLTITAYNITPDGQEAKAVETVYRRAS